MAGLKLFGARAAGAVTLVEPPVSRVYAMRARLAFFTVAAVVGLVLAAALSPGRGWLLASVVGLLAGLAVGAVVAVVVRLWPVLRAVWWWLPEIVLGFGALEMLAWLARNSMPLVAVAVFLALVCAVLVVGPVRRFVLAWGWCLVVRHRLRLSFAKVIRSANRSGAGLLPLVLWARPTPAGERVWLWLRPGLAVDDLDGRAGVLAVACWAKEVRVVPASERYAALLRVDVTRRDPLAGPVASPLAALVPKQLPQIAAVPSALPLALDLDDIPEEKPEERRGRR